MRLAITLAVLVPAFVLLVHVGLWSQGEWHDEYYGFGSYRLAGLGGELIRLRHWSPRPVSELLIFFYWLAVRAFRMPLVVPALAAAWGTLGIGLLAAARPWARPGRAARLALVLTLPALFLLAAPVGELFYWPFAALAYLPALSAACYAALALVGPGLRDRNGWVALAVALSLGAGSVEVGAFLALATAPGLLLAARHGQGGSSRLRIGAALAPLLSASTVILLLLSGRVARAAEMFGSPALFHHLGRDLWSAAGQSVSELLHPDGGSILAAASVKLLVFLGARACLRRAWPAPPPRAPIIALLVGLAATIFLSIAGAYYNFGTLCCERHATYRQALFLLMAAVSAGLARPARASAWGPALLASAVLIYLPSRLPAVRTEYSLAHARGAAWKAIFRSGWQPGPAPIDYAIAPAGPLFTYALCPPGIYRRTQDTPSNVLGPMLFFGKDNMRVRMEPPK